MGAIKSPTKNNRKKINPHEILLKAIHSERDRRFLESQHYYCKGIELLRDFVNNTRNTRTVKRYYEHILQYIERSKSVYAQVEKLLKTGEFLKSTQIQEDSQGHSYETLIGEYFEADVHEIYLEEPYLQRPYQVENLVIFLEMAVKKCPRLKFVKLLTNRVGNDANLRDIQGSLRLRGIEFIVERDPRQHDRKVALSTGIVKKIGRGLHIFKAANSTYSLGICDYDFRRCLKTDVDVWRSGRK
uniref:MITD1 C-terminal phospholipase D-like domain-containing protein n=1 Tax=Musca domestica TaxID=7370 RepID=A0A1I8N0U0_MUSDO